MGIIFKDIEHRDFYKEQLKKSNKEGDPYHEALFYVLGLTEETRRRIVQLYDFKKQCINFEEFSGEWQTSTTKRVCRLAFNLYNGFTGSEEIGDTESDYTPYNLFCDSLQKYMLEAIKIRYREYYHD